MVAAVKEGEARAVATVVVGMEVERVEVLVVDLVAAVKEGGARAVATVATVGMEVERAVAVLVVEKEVVWAVFPEAAVERAVAVLAAATVTVVVARAVATVAVAMEAERAAAATVAVRVAAMVAAVSCGTDDACRGRQTAQS